MYIIGVVVFLVFLILTVFAGGGIVAFIDLPSIMVILFFTLPVVIGSGLFKDLKRAFKVAMLKKNIFTQTELEKALLAVDLTMKMIVLSGVLGTIMGIIALLHYIEDMSLFGKNVSVALITVFYALFCTVLFLPIKAKINMFLIEIKNKSVQ